MLIVLVHGQVAAEVGDTSAVAHQTFEITETIVYMGHKSKVPRDQVQPEE
jgi:hypothetical protein